MRAQTPPRIPLVPASSILPSNDRRRHYVPSLHKGFRQLLQLSGAPQLLCPQDTSLDGTLGSGYKDATIIIGLIYHHIFQNHQCLLLNL